MRLGRSPNVVVRMGPTTQAIVYQPKTEVDVLGLRVACGF
jgi:hypothetical protein